MTPETKTELLNQREAAAKIGVSERTLEAWRGRRIGPRFLSISKRLVRYRQTDLDQWLNNQVVETQAN